MNVLVLLYIIPAKLKDKIKISTRQQSATWHLRNVCDVFFSNQEVKYRGNINKKCRQERHSSLVLLACYDALHVNKAHL